LWFERGAACFKVARMTTQFAPRHQSLIIYRTHFWDAACAREFARLQNALSDQYDLVVAGFIADPAQVPEVPDIPCFFSNMDDLARLGYPGLAALKPIHIDMFRIFRAYPDYRHYWMIEFDVRYTGDWAVLMRELSESPADVLGTVVQSRAEHPQWGHWKSFCPAAAVLPDEQYVKIFTPMTRLSNAAMRVIDAAYQAGWTGHFEVLWPTAAAAAGLLVEDIGGKGRFTPRSRYGRHYTTSAFHIYLTPGSFAFRPPIPESYVSQRPPALWHPVKPDALVAALPAAERPTWMDHPLMRPARRLRRRLQEMVR
jgi:hypothetical protein